MDNLDSLLKTLLKQKKTNWNTIKKLKEYINKKLDKNELQESMNLITQLLLKKNLQYTLIQLLLKAIQINLDISKAIPAVKKVTRIPKIPYLRSLAAKILSQYYVKLKIEKPLKPRAHLELPPNWSLKEISHRPVYCEPDYVPDPEEKVYLPCAKCGRKSVLKMYEHDFGGKGNTGGIEDIILEIKCLKCGKYSVYHYYEEIFPYD